LSHSTSKVVIHQKEIAHVFEVSGAQVIVAANLQTAQKLKDSLPRMMSTMVLKPVLSDEPKPVSRGWSWFYDIFVSFEEVKKETRRNLAL
jgi:hypothetical protein